MAPPKPPLTHFLCIPLVTPLTRPQLGRALAAFRADIVAGPDGLDLPPDAVRPPGTLHLTLGVMSFPSRGSGVAGAANTDASGSGGDGDGNGDGGGLSRAIQLLRTLKPREILGSAMAASSAAPRPPPGPAASDSPPSLDITLRGLCVMGGYAAKAAILYAPPADELGVLQRFGEGVRAAFLAAGLVVDEARPLLLHATVLNTVYATGPGRGGRGGAGRRSRGRRLQIDATGLLDRYRDHTWLEGLSLGTLAICRMGSKPVRAETAGEMAGAQAGPGEDWPFEDAEYEVEALVEF